MTGSQSCNVTVISTLNKKQALEQEVLGLDKLLLQISPCVQV